ncbi:hypothetical protein A2U01_0031095, partial [Trifolium medium]|nr:hypothetical protein [Trifolium medium]
VIARWSYDGSISTSKAQVYVSGVTRDPKMHLFLECYAVPLALCSAVFWIIRLVVQQWSLAIVLVAALYFNLDWSSEFCTSCA